MPSYYKFSRKSQCGKQRYEQMIQCKTRQEEPKRMNRGKRCLFPFSLEHNLIVLYVAKS